MSEKSIIVSNGIGRFHMYRSAEAAETAKLLKYFITSFCITKQWQFDLINTNVANSILGKNKAKKLLLRQYAGIDRNKTVSISLPELYMMVHGRMALSLRRYMPSVLSLFGRLSTPYVNNCDVFHVRSGFGNVALHRAKECGAIGLVDHSIASPEYLRRIEGDVTDQNSDNIIHSFDSQKWRLVRADLQEADLILANSEFVKLNLQEYEQIDPNKIRVIPMGVDVEIFRPPLKNPNTTNTFNILFVGTISNRKGIQYLLDAFEALKLQNAKLILIGAKGNAYNLLAKYHADVQYIAHVPHLDLIRYFQNANVFVFPSLAEGSALVTYEAMACGLPVITTEESGSVIQHDIDGFIVPSRNAEALAERIHFVYTNRDYGHSIGLAARRKILEYYTWDHYRNNINQLYKSCLVDRNMIAHKAGNP